MSISNLRATLKRGSFTSFKRLTLKTSNIDDTDYFTRRKEWTLNARSWLKKNYPFEYERVDQAVNERLEAYGGMIPAKKLKVAILEGLEFDLSFGSLFMLFSLLQFGGSEADDISFTELKVVLCMLSIPSTVIEKSLVVFKLFDTSLSKGMQIGDFGALLHALIGKSLNYLLEKVPFGREAFTKFLHRERNEELLYCYDEIKELLFDATTEPEKLYDFCNQYIAVDSPNEVNIADSLRTSVLQEVEAFRSNPSQKLTPKFRQLLCDVMEEVMDLMKQNSFRKFKQDLMKPNSVLTRTTWSHHKLKQNERMDYKNFLNWSDRCSSDLFFHFDGLRRQCERLLI